MSKKGTTFLAGAVVTILAIVVLAGFVIPWNSPLRVLFAPRSYEYQRLLHNAMANYQIGEMESAKPIFKELLKLKPDDPELHYRMGVVLSRLGETKDSISEFETAYKLSKSTMGEAQASIAAIHIQQGEELLKNDKYRDAGTAFDKAASRLDTGYQAIRGRKDDEKEALTKQFSLLRGQIYIGQGLSALLLSDRTDVAIERFATAENVFKAAEDLKPFREYRKLSHAYADLARVFDKSYLDKKNAAKYWTKSFSVMELAIASAQEEKNRALRFGDPYTVFRKKYEKELADLKKEAKGEKEPETPAPAPEPEKLDSAIEIFE